MTAGEVSVGPCTASGLANRAQAGQPSGPGDRFPTPAPLQARFTYFVVGYHLDTRNPRNSTVLTAGSPGRVARLWSADTGRLLQTLVGHAGRVRTAAFNPSGSRIATAADDSTVQVWDASSGRVLAVLPPDRDSPPSRGGVSRLAVSPDGTVVAIGHDDGSVRIWGWADRRVVQASGAFSLDVTSIAVSRDGARVAAGAVGGAVRVWDAKDGHVVTSVRDASVAAEGVAFSPDGRTIVATGHDATMQLWDVASGRLVRSFEGPRDVTAAVFSPDGGRILAVASPKSAILDAATGRRVATLEGDTPMMGLAAAFTPDGSQVMAGTLGDNVRVWDAASGRELAALEGDRNWIRHAALSPDGRRLLAGTDRERPDPAGVEEELWDTASGRRLATVGVRKIGIDYVAGLATSPAAFSPDGTLAAVVSGERGYVLDAETGREIARLSIPPGIMMVSPSFSPDGSRLTTVGDDAVYVWNPRSGRLLQKIGAGPGIERPARYAVGGFNFNSPSGPAVFSPDSRFLVMGAAADAVAIWDASASEVVAVVPGRSIFRFASFSPNGTEVLTNSSSQIARVLKVPSGELVAALGQPLGLKGEAWSGAFSQDGAQAVTVTGDYVTQLWARADEWRLPTDLVAGAGAGGGLLGGAGWARDGSPVVVTCDAAAD